MEKSADAQAHELLSVYHRESNRGSAKGDLEKVAEQGRLQRWFDGWRFTLFLSSLFCLVVFGFNLGFVLWVVARDRLRNDRGVLYEGDCDRVRLMSTGLHLLINIFSSVLLAASNYGMQCLGAPTREDVDRVHQAGTWVDIGVSSLRNLVYLSKKRLLLWILLALSSAPLHLLYNSTISSTTSTYEYAIFAGPGRLWERKIDNLKIEDKFRLSKSWANSTFSRLLQAAQDGSLIRLDPSECIDAYVTTYQTTYGSLVLVTQDSKPADIYDLVATQPVHVPGLHVPYAWLCPPLPELCTSYLPKVRSQAAQGNWSVHGNNNTHHVDYCLAESLPAHCKLQYSLSLIIAVLVSNIIKGGILFYMSFKKTRPPMLTMGDAIASFLSQPDSHSLDRCLVPGKKVEKLCAARELDRYGPMAVEFSNKPTRWFSAVSYRKWTVGLIPWLLVTPLCIGLVLYGQHMDGPDIWDGGFGSINPQTVIVGPHWPKSLIANTVIANAPQLIFTMMYFTVNSIVTNMTLAAEWSQYAITRKGLRVSWARQAAQRSSYFLSLPYRYALPLMAASALLHWLISQSLYIVSVEAYDVNWHRDPFYDIMSCGYTPIAVVATVAVAAIFYVCLIALSRKKLKSGMFVAGSCSLAISAACHPLHDPNQDCKVQELGTVMAFNPVKWGAVPVDGELGHCSFSALDVDLPEDGRLYQ